MARSILDPYDLNPSDILLPKGFFYKGSPATKSNSWDDVADHKKSGKPTRPPALPEGKPFRLRVATANIKYSLPPAKERADIVECFQHADLIGFQEIRPHTEAKLIQKVIDERFPNYTLVHTGYETCIAFNKTILRGFDLAAKRNPNRARFKGGRYSGSTGIAFRTPNNTTLAFCNVHLIVRGYNKPPPPNTPERRAQWKREYKDYATMIESYHAKNATVLFVGDFNRYIPCPLPVPKSRFIFNSGIDKIGVYPNSHRSAARIKSEGRVISRKLYSDHKLRVAHLLIF